MTNMFKWLISYSRRINYRYIIIIPIGVIKILASLAFVYSSKRIIDIATGALDAGFGLWAAYIICAMIVNIGMNSLSVYMEKVGSVKMQNMLRAYLFSNILSAVWSGREKLHSGDAMNRIERDVKDVSDFLYSSLPQFVVTILQFCGAFCFMFLLDWRLGALLVGIVPLFLLVSKVWYRRMRRLTSEVRESDSKIQSHIQEGIQNRLVVKTHNAHSHIIDKLSHLQFTLIDQTVGHTRFTVFSNAIISMGFAAGYIFALIYGARQVELGLLSFGSMIAVLQLVGMIQRPIVQMGSIIPLFTSAATAAERIDALNDLECEAMDKQIVLNMPCGVEFSDVDFAYSDGEQRNILNSFSFIFEPKSRTIITGNTGVGKSTLFRLIMGLVKPTLGTVSIFEASSGRSIAPDSSSRLNIIYVPQGNSLFSGTIRSNLLLGNPLATEDDMQQALTTSVAEFVYGLPDGLDTICGERGGALSEGQAQRIAIARALLGHGSVLLFDEFTSALDQSTENELIVRLQKAYPDKTMIFITHRREAFLSMGYNEVQLCST